MIMPYALFDRDRQLGGAQPTVRDVWTKALESGLIADVPVADEEDEQILPVGYHVKEVAN
jgi:hypothetical protein